MSEIFRKMPTAHEAVQFDGENWAEMHEFTGHHFKDGREEDVFAHNGDALLWVEGDDSYIFVNPGDWIVKVSDRDEDGFRRVSDVKFQKDFILDEEFAEYTGMQTVSGDIPVLNENASDTRMIARIRLSLILHRPMSEVEAITERLIWILSNYRVGVEEGAYERLDATVAETLRKMTIVALIEAVELGITSSEAEAIADLLVEKNLLQSEFHDDETLQKAHQAITKAVSGWTAHSSDQLSTEVISELQNAGILFRERMKNA